MRQLTNEEKILKYIIKKYKDSKYGKINLDLSDAEQLNVSKNDFAKSITLLQEKYITVIRKSVQNDFWQVAPTSDGVNYFSAKQEHRNDKRREVIISIISVVIGALIRDVIGLIANYLPLLIQALEKIIHH